MAMRPISYEVDSFPQFIRSESAARKAVERGLITPDTLVIAYGDNGERERMRAGDHPLLASLFAPEPAPVEEQVLVDASTDTAPVDAPVAVEEPAPAPPADPPPSPPRRKPVPPAPVIEPQPVAVKPGPTGKNFW